jgi:redox-sensitive bicupin YhaK (pirin superfamily)
MKQLKSILQSTGTHWVGNGFPVRSVFSYDTLGEELDPFLLLDYAAPHLFPPGTEKRGVGAHPHRGFETVTISYQGEIEHRDSSGGGGKIGPGDVQWMTAASGLLHEEFHSAEFTRTGGMFEMAQLWVNLPARAKSAPPGYQTLLKQEIPVVSLPEGAGEARVIAGQLHRTQGPGRTFTPINLWDVKIHSGKSATFPLTDGHTVALLMMNGDLSFQDDHHASEGALVLFEREGNDVQVTATEDTRLLLMSGEPLNEPIVGSGPFVMNSESEIQQAFRDVRAGRMGSL